MTRRTDLLHAVPALRSCSEDTLNRLSRSGQLCRLKAREILFHQGAAEEGIYLQLSGRSLLYTVTQMGQRRVFEIIDAGMLLNPTGLTEPSAFAHCEMLQRSELLCIPREVFLDCACQDGALNRAVLLAHRRCLCHMEQQIRNCVSSLSGVYRMASLLRDLAEEFGVERRGGLEIDLELNVSLLGDFLGIPRESASRHRKALVQSGLVSVQGKRITILNPERLEAFLKNETHSSGL